MFRPPGIDHGGFVVSPDSVWYAQVLLLFSTSEKTNTGSKTFDCALLSTLETYNDPENGNFDIIIASIASISFIVIITIIVYIGI